MRVLKLDTKEVVDLGDREAIELILNDVAVEVDSVQQPKPESAMLDRTTNTMTKPRPEPKPAPQREKRGRRKSGGRS